MLGLQLYKDSFNEAKRLFFENDSFKIYTFKYQSGVLGLRVENTRGYFNILPFEGLIIWDAVIDGIDLKMKNTFKQPYAGDEIVDSYGPFQFHSGLLASGNPGPDDDHKAHGEFPLSQMDRSAIQVADDKITIRSQVEYVKGFGDHYLATPALTIFKDSGLFDIEMTVKNLSQNQEMPLQYLTHINYKFVEGAKITQNIPDEAFHLRTSVPDHIHPTQSWLDFTKNLADTGKLINELDDVAHFDPEIVYFGDELDKYTQQAVFHMQIDNQHSVKVAFDTTEFPDVTRWLMNNPDLQVAAFALPATSRTEGRTAAREAGTLIMLAPQEERHFKVTTGLED
ncbi:DUF4432 family protein [Furfurilactobacillus siliginis]|uniref:DUF4432 domain-containing protein n=1 Tax=Furfurilactobacillus siliginis TaxID=348151 RepID=A0A0R2KZS0_9LACO|nr:DUF4432 family protein [Furfurilactobacillus siliginis]KRN94878.1 DeoX [Furfurilactobacillus siliginis]GEK28449.1 DUF4432 domain-containing protein [Furfurilactobacillus siliginis]